MPDQDLLVVFAGGGGLKGGERSHNNEIDKVDRGSFVEACVVVILIDAIRQGAEFKPKRRKRDTRAPEIPICHREGGDGLENADEAIRLEDEPPVDKTVLSGIAGRPEQDVGFWRFEGEDGCSGAVGEAAGKFMSMF